MECVNGKSTAFAKDEQYHAPKSDDIIVLDREDMYRTVVGDPRYLVDCTRPDMSYNVGRLRAAIPDPSARHWKLVKSTLRYLTETKNYGSMFRRYTNQEGIHASFKKRRIKVSSDVD